MLMLSRVWGEDWGEGGRGEGEVERLRRGRQEFLVFLNVGDGVNAGTV